MTDRPPAGPDTTPADTTAGTPPVRILHYADLENAYDEPSRIGRLAGELRARRDDRTLIIGAGDDTALGVLALLTDEARAQARPFFEAVAPDVDTLGNHDLDLGDDWIADWAGSVPTTYVCANIEGPVADGFPDSVVLERGGLRVGVVGVGHPETHDISGADFDSRFTDPVAAACDAVDDLRERGVDHVVVTSHAGTHDDDLARGVDADVVLGGHIHRRRTERVDGTLLVRTDGNGTEFAEVTLGEEASVRFHVVDDLDGATGSAAGAERADAAANGGTESVDADTAGPFDADLAEEYCRRRAAVGVDEPIAVVDDPLPRDEEARFGGESRLGNFAADAFRAAADADVGLFPGGSLRPGPPLHDEVTVGDVVGVCPFGGEVMALSLTGAELEAALEHVAVPLAGDRGWVQLHVSGMAATWTDDDALQSVRVGGEPVEPEASYRVATAAYVVVVDGYGPLDRDHVVASHVPQYEALVEHARNGGLAVGLEGRIGRVQGDAPAE